jgi:hypothetical protein
MTGRVHPLFGSGMGPNAWLQGINDSGAIRPDTPGTDPALADTSSCWMICAMPHGASPGQKG